jgi:threonine dehydrogenase-like Zn-dependent dehydrogenase
LHTPLVTKNLRVFPDQELFFAIFLQTGFHLYLETISKMTFPKSKAKQKVAIVGSGMAGLVTAHLLHHDPRQRYSVAVFESVRMSQHAFVSWSNNIPSG